LAGNARWKGGNARWAYWSSVSATAHHLTPLPLCHSPLSQALILALSTLQPLAVQMLAGQGEQLSAVRDGVAAMRIEADEGAVALCEQLRSAADLAKERHGQAELVTLLRGMAVGPPTELVAELRREMAAVRAMKNGAEEALLLAILKASLALAAAEPSGAGASSSPVAAVPPAKEVRERHLLSCRGGTHSGLCSTQLAPQHNITQHTLNSTQPPAADAATAGY